MKFQLVPGESRALNSNDSRRQALSRQRWNWNTASWSLPWKKLAPALRKLHPGSVHSSASADLSACGSAWRENPSHKPKPHRDFSILGEKKKSPNPNKTNQNALGRWSWWFLSGTEARRMFSISFLWGFFLVCFTLSFRSKNLKNRGDGKWHHVVLTHKAVFGAEFVQKEPSEGFMSLHAWCHNSGGRWEACSGETITDFGHRQIPFICFYNLLSQIPGSLHGHLQEWPQTLLQDCAGKGPLLVCR